MISIEVFKSNQANRKVISRIEDREISALRGVFDCFESKTGIFIDEYGKTLLHNSSISILLECFEESIKDSKDMADIKGTSKNLMHLQHHKLVSRQGTHLKD